MVLGEALQLRSLAVHIIGDVANDLCCTLLILNQAECILSIVMIALLMNCVFCSCLYPYILQWPW